MPEPNTGCILWFGTTAGRGYGYVSIGGDHFYTHHLAWRVVNGDIPEGKVVRHDCDTPPCINPDHLRLGTVLENVQDKIRRGRHIYGEKSPLAKLTADLVQEAREARQAGETFSSIASRMGVGRQTAEKAIKGQTWKHVPFPAESPSSNNTI